VLARTTGAVRARCVQARTLRPLMIEAHRIPLVFAHVYRPLVAQPAFPQQQRFRQKSAKTTMTALMAARATISRRAALGRTAAMAGLERIDMFSVAAMARM